MVKRRRSKKWIFWLVILILIIAAGVVCYLVWDSYFKDNAKEQESEQVVETEEAMNDETADEQADEKKIKQYEGEDPNKASELSGVVTYAGAQGSILAIRVNIDQYLGDGTCELSLSRNGGAVYTDKARIVAGASTSTCEGFDVPVDRLGGGKLEIKINLKSGDKTGVIYGEVNI